MLPEGQEALCERCVSDSWNRGGFRATLKRRPDDRAGQRWATFDLGLVSQVGPSLGLRACSAAFKKEHLYRDIAHFAV